MVSQVERQNVCWPIYWLQLTRIYTDCKRECNKILGRFCKKHKMARAPIEDSDQPAHPRRLISVFDGRSMDG